MREESHLDDMRAAIRGDFERLEERRGEQVLLRPRENPDSEPYPSDSLVGVEDETVAATPLAEPPTPTKRSWIDRLLGL